MWVALCATFGCYHAVPPEGAPCVSDSDCPASLTCVMNECSRGPAIDAPVDSVAIDAFDLCTCSAGTQSCSLSGQTMCALGCSASGPHCSEVMPSNGIPVTDLDGATMDVVIASGSTGGPTTFDVNTGEISGAITRAAGTGVIDGIGYYQHADSVGANTLAEFSMKSLTVSGTVEFSGSHSVVFLVATDAIVTGAIDASGGAYGKDPQAAGPGAGPGGLGATPAAGCGAGGTGATDSGTGADTGGGGGGYGGAGAAGGIETASMENFAGGTAGVACVGAGLEPLLGGSGGGGGGPGAGTALPGGGGGGALQISALGKITVSGTINAGGAGGSPGPTNPSNAGAGGGGGSGGGILLEALTVSISGVLAANGGGGGGSSDHAAAGTAGANGFAGATPAQPGTPGGSAATSGAGGSRPSAPGVGGNSSDVNSGAGGGGVGAIFIRTAPGASLPGGTISPTAGTGIVRSQ